MIPEQLSSTEAAAQLGVSRTTPMKLIAAGEIEAHTLGSHHRLLAKDVLAFGERRRAQRLETLSQLRELDDEAGLGT